MPTTISLLARKGGVGRTTIAVSLAGEFADRGARVLCIDLDGQASLSRVFFGSSAVEQLDAKTTTAAVIADYGAEAAEVIHQTKIKDISVVPASDALEKLATPDHGEGSNTVRALIASVAEQFDVVLIDSPPNTNVATTWAGLVASDYVISPVPANAFGTQSIISVQRAVGDAVSENPPLRILGYVLNQVQRNSVHSAYIQMVRQLHGSQVFTTEIPQGVAFQEAMAVGEPVKQHKKKNKAARVIASLADEIGERIEALQGRKAA